MSNQIADSAPHGGLVTITYSIHAKRWDGAYHQDAKEEKIMTFLVDGPDMEWVQRKIRDKIEAFKNG